MSLLILVVDDEPDVEVLFRQQFRRDLRAVRFMMEFAYSASAALERIGNAEDASLILILSDINMPGMSGLELLPRAKALRPDVPPVWDAVAVSVTMKAKPGPQPTRPGDMLSFCRNANAEKTAIHLHALAHTVQPYASFEAPWMQRSELGRKIPVDL